MKQNVRKNKTNQSVTWPNTAYFTIRDVVKLNSKMLTSSESDITLRVRLIKEVESGKITEIGWLLGGKGRPRKVYAMTPVSQTVLNAAKADNISLLDSAEKLVNVLSVNQPKVTSTPAPATTPTVVVK